MKIYRNIWRTIFVIVMLTACSTNTSATITLQQKFHKEFDKVNNITITNGETGELRKVTDHEQIQTWIDRVKDIELTPLDNQEKRDGFLYSIVLYQDNKKLSSFSLGYINDVYYSVDEQMLTLTEQLFERRP